jgi:hypothetical protein
VWDLYQETLGVAPRAPVRWMLPQLGVSDAMVRRWIGRARLGRGTRLAGPLEIDRRKPVIICGTAIADQGEGVIRARPT